MIDFLSHTQKKMTSFSYDFSVLWHFWIYQFLFCLTIPCLRWNSIESIFLFQSFFSSARSYSFLMLEQCTNLASIPFFNHSLATRTNVEKNFDFWSVNRGSDSFDWFSTMNLRRIFRCAMTRTASLPEGTHEREEKREKKSRFLFHHQKRSSIKLSYFSWQAAVAEFS